MTGRVINMAYKSRYSYFFQRKDGTWGAFNSLSSALIIMSDEEKKALDTLCNTNIIINSEFENQLLSLGFLHDDAYDEQSIVNLSRARSSRLENEAYIRILTTTECNAQCQYCYEKDFFRTTMSSETAEYAVKFILENPKIQKLYIHWFGGEPLLNTPIIDLIMNRINARLNERPMEITTFFTSNGSLIDKTLAEKAKKEWNAKWFQITLDDLYEDYDNVKQYKNKDKYNFSKVISGIQNLLHNGIRVTIRVNFLPEEIKKVNQITDFLVKRFQTYCASQLLQIHPAPIFESSASLSDHIIRKSRCCNLFETNMYIASKDIMKNYDPFDLNVKNGQCFACHYWSFVISPTGDLYKCALALNNQSERVGSVYWGVDKNDAYVKWINPELPKECNICPLLPICQGGCRAGVFGYLDHSCNYIFSELNKILECKICTKHSTL